MAILRYQGTKQTPCGLRVGQHPKRFHAEFNTINPSGLRPLYRGLWHPLGSHMVAFVIHNLGAGRYVVARSVLGNVAIMQVGETFIPVFAVETAWIGV